MSKDQFPRNCWYVVALSRELGKRPLQRKVLGLTFVLFRGSDGQAVALDDRCPHKKVSLSLGRVEKNHIRCPYHGWAFSSSGSLAEVPCDSPGKPIPKCKVPSYPVVEQDGWIWLYPIAEARPEIEPPKYPKTPGIVWWDYVNVMKAPPELIMENGFDCSHTGFVHKGLFRSEPTQYIKVLLEETPTGMRATTRGEKKSKKFDSRAFTRSDHEIVHTDELIAPHTVYVEYKVGADRFVTVLLCTPEDEHTTRVHTRIGLRYSFVSRIVWPFVYALIAKVISQDKVILENQAANLRDSEERFVLVTADAPTAWMRKAMKDFFSGKWPRTESKAQEVIYKL